MPTTQPSLTPPTSPPETCASQPQPSLDVKVSSSAVMIDASASSRAISNINRAYSVSSTQPGVFLDVQTYIVPSNYIHIVVETPMTATTDGVWTISVWVLAPFTNTGDCQTLTAGSTGDHQIMIDNDGQLGTYDDTGNRFWSSSLNVFTSLISGQWYHLAVAASGMGSAGTTTFFVDGVVIRTVPFAVVGNLYHIFSLHGIQEFRPAGVFGLKVFDSTLSQACVTELMLGDKGMTGTVALWHCGTVAL